jgi:hypothetical protein
MKKALFSKILFLVIALALLAFTYAETERGATACPAYSEYSGRVMGYRELTLLPDTKAADLERFATEQLTPTFRNQVPGIESYIIKGQRGDNKGISVHLLIFDSKRTSDFDFPVEGEGEPGIPVAALNLWKPGQIMLLDSLPKYTQPLTSQSGYTDYVFLE